MKVLWFSALINVVLFLPRVAIANVVVLRESNVTEADYVSYGAFFGSVVDSDGITGYLVYADPPEACDTIVPRSSFDKNVTVPRKWIALLKRGKCSFSHKVWVAQEAGYDAAIVHNVNSQALIHMSSSGDDNVHIPSVFVGEREGIELRQRYQWNTGFYIVVTDEFPIININTILLPFAIVVGVCFLMLFGFVVGRWIRERRRQQRHRLPKRELRKIPTKKYAVGDKYDVCAICLEQFAVGEKVRVLPCDHMYHIKCIDPWLLNSKRVCPVCKQKVIPGDHSDSEDDEQQQHHMQNNNNNSIVLPAPALAVASINSIHDIAATHQPQHENVLTTRSYMPGGTFSAPTANDAVNGAAIVVASSSQCFQSSSFDDGRTTPDALHAADAFMSSSCDELKSGLLPYDVLCSSSSHAANEEHAILGGNVYHHHDDLSSSPSVLQKLVGSDESMMPLLTSHVPTGVSCSSNDHSVANVNGGAAQVRLAAVDDDTIVVVRSSSGGGNHRGRSASHTHEAISRAAASIVAAPAIPYDRSVSNNSIASRISGGSSSGKRSASSFYVNKSFDATDESRAGSSRQQRGNSISISSNKRSSLVTTVDINNSHHRDFGQQPSVDGGFKKQVDDAEPTAASVRMPVIRRKKQRYDSNTSTETSQSYVDDGVIVAAVDADAGVQDSASGGRSV